MRAAVIGAGIFGATTAVDLARAGWRVDLFEARDDILHGATARCQARLHRGYHYPRSDATAAAARDGAPEFAARYPDAIRSAAQHHYVIAEDSKVSAGDYLAFLDRMGLPYEVVPSPMVHHAQLVVRVPESFVDAGTLRRLLRRDLILSGVQIHLGRWVAPEQLSGYDLIVAATYGQPWSRPLRYELCEVALVEVARYRGQSVVVLDGDHVSLDPFSKRAHMLYDVANSVHLAKVGYGLTAGEYHDLLAAWGPQKTPRTHLKSMLANAGRHLRGMDPSGQGSVIYHGSLFAVRAVLPDVDETDERPTLVERDGNVVSILGGKLCTAVSAGRQVLQLVGETVPA